MTNKSVITFNCVFKHDKTAIYITSQIIERYRLNGRQYYNFHIHPL